MAVGVEVLSPIPVSIRVGGCRWEVLEKKKTIGFEPLRVEDCDCMSPLTHNLDGVCFRRTLFWIVFADSLGWLAGWLVAWLENINPGLLVIGAYGGGVLLVEHSF